MDEDLGRQVEQMLLEDARKKESEELLSDAKKKAAQIIKDAEDEARAVYGASLEYVDDMLSEVSLVVLRAKEEMKKYCEELLLEFDRKAERIDEQKNTIMEQLKVASENGNRPVKKVNYEIKVDESYFPKREYTVKSNDGSGVKTETYKPAKQPFEIKIADEWKDRIESMLMEEQQYEEPVIEEPEPEEEEEGYQASDFDLDAEYFSWLNEQDKKGK